jgi:hypothetical protein
MSKLPYLVNEINAAMEIYISGRTGQQYNRTVFILVDDAAELAIKLFLLTDLPTWSDTKAAGKFKSFWNITAECRAVFAAKRATELDAARKFLERIEGRRTRRNEFFHSTSLLDLNLHPRDCVDAVVDLLDFGKLLFPVSWDVAVAASGNMETSETLFRLDKKAYADPAVAGRLNTVLNNWPRNSSTATKKGCEVAHHAEDLHLRLAIRNGGKALRERLQLLL